MAHKKERELLEKFRKFVNDDCDLDYLDHSYIDMFLSTLPEEKEEPDYKNCTNEIVATSGSCKLGLDCRDCRFHFNPSK